MTEGYSPLYSDDADVAQWDRGEHHSHWRLRHLHADGIQSGNLFLQCSKLNYFFYSQDNLIFDIGMLAVLAVGFRVLAFLFLLMKTFRWIVKTFPASATFITKISLNDFH